MLSDTPWVYPIVLQFNIIVVYKQNTEAIPSYYISN